jgi:hypothetical protein
MAPVDFDAVFDGFKPLITTEISPPVGWVLPNRVKFPSYIQETFRYNATKKAPRNLFPYQRFVKDYLQPASPYRGLLLFHELGTGKSCSSIVAAENFMNEMGVVVLLPASLRPNYVNQIRTRCGNTYFSTKQQWQFVSNKDFPGTQEAFSSKTFVPLKLLRKNKGAWVPVTTLGRSFNDLTDQEKRVLNEQLDEMVQMKYEFLNYNGLRSSGVDELEQRNAFDNKVIIIDEVHNFISRTIGGGPKAEGEESIGKRLYKMLIAAKNCKIIALSGTPIINHPFEVSYLLNLLAGMQRRHVFSKVKTDLKDAAKHLDAHPRVDHYTLDAAKQEIAVKLVPSGFAFADKEALLVAKQSPNAKEDATTISELGKVLGVKSTASSPTTRDTFLFPFDKEVFTSTFLDFSTNSVKEPRKMARRMMGLISFFGTFYGDLYPTVLSHKFVAVPMTDTQFKQYEESRLEELKIERRSKQQGSNDPFSKVPQVYRAYSRALCNFAFPESIKRPFPSRMSMMEKEMDVSEGEAESPDTSSASRSTVYNTKLAEAIKALEASGTLQKDKLGELSPKFLAFLRLVNKCPGKALVYSQFRVVEGLGILAMVLEANGWCELRLKKTTGGVWDVADTSQNKKPKFFQYRNNDETKIILQIFNNNFENVPASLLEKLGATSNLRGELVKLAMITQSGAEGISLKHVREVHILEPYWNEIRINQVIGRAVRAESHKELPPPERNVQVYRYMAKITPKQVKASKTLQNKDDGKSTDEHIYGIAERKAKIIKAVEEVMKSAAVDCMIHKRYHPGVECLYFPENAPLEALAYELDLSKDESNAEYAQRVKPSTRVHTGFRDCGLDGVRYAYSSDDKTLYDLEAYKQGKLVKMGSLKKVGDAWRVV